MNKLESIALVLTLTILLLFIVLILALTINSLMEIGSSAMNYYNSNEHHKSTCLTLAESSESNVQWVDETILGFGKDGSYGCFLLEEENGGGSNGK